MTLSNPTAAGGVAGESLEKGPQGMKRDFNFSVPCSIGTALKLYLRWVGGQLSWLSNCLASIRTQFDSQNPQFQNKPTVVSMKELRQ